MSLILNPACWTLCVFIFILTLSIFFVLLKPWQTDIWKEEVHQGVGWRNTGSVSILSFCKQQNAHPALCTLLTCTKRVRVADELCSLYRTNILIIFVFRQQWTCYYVCKRFTLDIWVWRWTLHPWGHKDVIEHISIMLEQGLQGMFQTAQTCVDTAHDWHLTYLFVDFVLVIASTEYFGPSSAASWFSSVRSEIERIFGPYICLCERSESKTKCCPLVLLMVL